MEISQVLSAYRQAAKNIRASWDRFLGDKNGATAIEYGLIVGGLSVAIIAVIFNLGEDLDNLFQHLGNKLRER